MTNMLTSLTDGLLDAIPTVLNTVGPFVVTIAVAWFVFGLGRKFIKH